MILLAITLTAVFVLRKYARKPKKYRPIYTTHTVAPTVSPAELQKREKERERAAREAERARVKAEREAEKERKAEEERAQAREDIPYWENRLEQLYEQIEDANNLLYTARRTCKHDSAMNTHGAVIAEKIVAKHISERDKLMRKVMQIESQIHAAETKLKRAQYVAAN